MSIQSELLRDIAGVTFDLEGTLIDLEPYHFMAFEHALKDFGINMTVDEITRIDGVIGGGDPFIVRTLAKMHALGTAELHVLHLQKDTHFDKLLKERSIEPRPGAIKVITFFRENHLPLAIGSLTPRLRGMSLLEKSDLMQYFLPERIVFAEDVHEPKPHPAVYAQTASRMRIAPEIQLVFEDSPVGVRAARLAHSPAIAVPVPTFQESHHLEKLRSEGAVAVFENWKEASSTLMNKIFA